MKMLVEASSFSAFLWEIWIFIYKMCMEKQWIDVYNFKAWVCVCVCVMQFKGMYLVCLRVFFLQESPGIEFYSQLFVFNGSMNGDLGK